MRPTLAEHTRKMLNPDSGERTHIGTGQVWVVGRKAWLPTTACGLHPDRSSDYPPRRSLVLVGRPEATCEGCRAWQQRETRQILSGRRADLDRRKARKRQGVPKGPARPMSRRQPKRARDQHMSPTEWHRHLQRDRF